MTTTKTTKTIRTEPNWVRIIAAAAAAKAEALQAQAKEVGR